MKRPVVPDTTSRRQPHNKVCDRASNARRTDRVPQSCQGSCARALGQAVLTPRTGRRPAAGAWRRGLAGDLFRIRPSADAGLPLAAISGHRTEARPRPLCRSGCGTTSHRVSVRSGRSRRPAERHDRHEGTGKAAPAVQGDRWRSKRQMPVVWPGWVDRLSCAAAGRGPLGAPAMETPRRRAKMEPGWRCGRQDIRPRSAPEARCLVQISTPCEILVPATGGTKVKICIHHRCLAYTRMA
ncbi:MAG: hypothetical protein RLZZ413_2313 [Pseudomonadota bacterium]